MTARKGEPFDPSELDALVAEAERLEQLAATVHERHACPKCHSPIGVRCWDMRPRARGRTLTHSHAERRRLEVPDR